MSVRLGDPAPDFTAQTTHGELSFHEWKGDSWAVLFSHPADFTPVCTTELGEVARLREEWDKRDVKVIGLSVDSNENHEQWKADIEETQGIDELDFPMIADVDREVSTRYDMIHPNAAANTTVRSVFVIGPDNTVKLSLTYPPSTGRDFREILRAIDSLQLTASEGLATPVNWQHGDRVIVTPAISDEEAKERFENFEAPRPYLRYVDQPA